jgi:hypothetical protein
LVRTLLLFKTICKEPPLKKSRSVQKIVSHIEKSEAKITALSTEIALFPQQKEAVFKKYL